ncbi:MAG: 50S ribosomal protein L4 [Parcubacteria group bacterium RIFOXYD2_FULL_52_8]|nr:ribosomal protein L4 [uncultured bacterium]OHB24631.1 MAG: 50S ribosomal protein L4 [Parcubacteria group bacterium RIFOXYD2_FULL_52_8]
MNAKIYNQGGKEQGTIDLSPKLFDLPWNADLVNQVVLSMQANQRQVTAHAKNRGEVSGGGKKPWRQKGTGRARHGSTRSPIWRHGGATHGPRNDKVYARTVTKKMKARALLTILSAKFRDGELLFVDQMALDAAKTKAAQATVKQLAAIPGFEKMTHKKGKRAFFALPAKNDALYKSFRNIPSVVTEELRNLNPVDALTYKYVVIVNPKESLGSLATRLV